MSEVIVDTLKHSGNSGTANVTLASNGNVTVAGALSAGSFTGAGLFTSYAIICDQKDSTTDGGDFTTGAWRTRNLNTEIADPDGIVSISSNQFTLQAGTYLIKWSAPAYDVDRHVTRLYDVTNSALRQYGKTMYVNSSDNIQSDSNGFARITISGATAYEIQHSCQTSNSVYGLGVASETTAAGAYSDGTTEGYSIFTVVEIYKEA